MKKYNHSKLENGLQIITSENAGSEVVTISVWVRAGSRYENEKELGYAHLLEHMMLKGSEDLPSALALSKTIDRIGAAANAFTGPGRIYFFVSSARHHLEGMVKVLAGMIRRPLLDAAILENEKKVVIQEQELAISNYSKRLWETTVKRIFADHPLGQRPLGTKESVQKARIGNLRDYHKKIFCPHNTAFIVSGGVKHSDIIALAEKYFGDWDGEINLFQEKPIQLSNVERTYFEKVPSKQTFLSLSWVGPAPTPEDKFALYAISKYIGFGQSSRLVEELRHKQGLVYSVFAENNPFRETNLFYVETATTKPAVAIHIIKELMENLESDFGKKTVEILKEQTIDILSMETSDSLRDVRFLGENWALYDKLISFDDAVHFLRQMNQERFRHIVANYLRKGGYYVTALGAELFPLD